MATATAKKPALSGMRSRLQGVPGEMVSGDEIKDLAFGAGGKMASPYVPLLEQLKTAAPGSALKFGDIRARAAIHAQAKKLKIPVQYAVKGTNLYVKLAPQAPEANASSEPEVKSVRQNNKTLILAALSETPRTAIAVAEYVRKNGNPTMDAALAETILGQLLRERRANERMDRGVSWWTLSA